MRFNLLLSLLIAIALIFPVHALKETTIYMPAVQENEYGQSGVMATLSVNVREGSGHVYVDTWPLTKVDTQASARIAKEVSCDALLIDCSKYDFLYTIRSDAEIVGGPSGGAAMTVATLASLLDLNLNNRVLITGTINLDGSIGPISGILEKAQVSSEKGDAFLIPSGQSEVVINKNSTDLKKYAKENWNLTIAEVSDIKEAFEYFTNYKIKERTVEFRKTPEYQKVMKIFALELMNHSKTMQTECLSKLKGAKIDSNNSEKISELCSKTLEDSQTEFSRENYYSAASLAFSNSISYKYGNKLIGLLSSQDKKEFTKIYLDSIKVKNLSINSSNIELYAIIAERSSEAMENMDESWKEYYSENYTESIYSAAYAEERLYTTDLWTMHSSDFPSSISETNRDLEEISQTTISDSYSILTYSSIVAPNSFSLEAQNLIDSAKEKQKKGDYITAIVMGIKAKANAEIASEVSGKTNYDGLIELHKNRALVSINQSNSNSVIGQSYFEYASTLESSKNGKLASLVYYTYAEKLSKLNSILNKSPASVKIEPSEFIEPLKCNCLRPILSPLSFLSSLLFFGFII